MRRLLAKIVFGALLALGILNVPLCANEYPFDADWIDTRDKKNSFGPVPDSAIVGNPPPVLGPHDRIGWSSDGTVDTDDWAATAMGWAILAKAKLQGQFVHLDYNNRLDKSDKKKDNKRLLK